MLSRLTSPVRFFILTVLSRIFELVNEYELSQGRIWRRFYRLGAKTILSWLDAREFADLLADRDLAQSRTTDGIHVAKFWRWRGILTRYVEEGARIGTQAKPALLCVHGFGASTQHWGRNIGELSKDHHVFAFCQIGFGRSEKPPMKMTQHVWETVTAEFVRDVIGRKVFIAGNSIGGALAAAFASDTYPQLCAGITLLNTAGSLSLPAELSAVAGVSPKKASFVATAMKSNRFVQLAFGTALLNYLQGNIEKTLDRVYPTKDPSWNIELAAEIRRNSCDWGAVGVSKFLLHSL
jgi:pimeloyl-ACP methyl ester carboxylesterase